VISVLKGEAKMEILAIIKKWSNTLADVGVSVIALLIVLEILFKGIAIPFMPTVSVTSNVTAIVGAIGAQGLVGLIAVWVLYSIWKNK
jgi:hypothetical protein